MFSRRSLLSTLAAGGALLTAVAAEAASPAPGQAAPAAEGKPAKRRNPRRRARHETRRSEPAQAPAKPAQ